MERAISGLPRRCEADAWEEEQRGFYRARRWLAEGKTEGLSSTTTRLRESPRRCKANFVSPSFVGAEL